MSPAIFGFLVGCSWFVIFMIVHVLILRNTKRTSPSRVLTCAITAAAIGAFISVLFHPLPSWRVVLLAEVYSFMAISALFILYGPFFYTIHTSLSIQSLLIVRERGGRMPVADLIERFASRQLLEERLMTMVASNYLIYEGNAFAPTATGRRVGHAFNMLKSAWRLGAGG